MKTILHRVTCDVCGHEGVGNSSTLLANFTEGGFVSHANPRVCADNLKRDHEAKLSEQKKTSSENKE